MTASHSNPRLATLQQSFALFRGEWILLAANPCQEFIAFHEVRESDGTPKIVEKLRFSSLSQVNSFVAYLFGHGWRQV